MRPSNTASPLLAKGEPTRSATDVGDSGSYAAVTAARRLPAAAGPDGG